MEQSSKKTVRHYVWGGVFSSCILAFVIAIIGALPAFPGQNLLKSLDTSPIGRGFWELAFYYIVFVFEWIALLVALAIFPKGRICLRTFGSGRAGNTPRMLLIGYGIGFCSNMAIALVAMASGNFTLHFSQFNPLVILFFLVIVFIQSSYEEALCRGFVYNRILRTYQRPSVAIAGSALMFIVLHLANPGATILSMANIAVIGILYALIVYYFDSLWCVMGIHAAWNFTQNILLGLPNSGIESTFSIFALNSAAATNGIAYDTVFGLEGSITALLLNAAEAVVVVIIGKRYKTQQEIKATSTNPMKDGSLQKLVG